MFELSQIGEAGGAVFLSDGTFNLALLPETGGTATGLKALGFDSVDRADSHEISTDREC